LRPEREEETEKIGEKRDSGKTVPGGKGRPGVH